MSAHTPGPRGIGPCPDCGSLDHGLAGANAGLCGSAKRPAPKITEANRTIGSWILTDENRARRVIRGKRADGKPVTVCIIEDWVREEDAVMLAASRDLLAACERVAVALDEEKHPDGQGYWSPSLSAVDVRLIRAAIAQARGGALERVDPCAQYERRGGA